MAEFKYEGRDLEAMSFARNYHAWILSFFRPFLGRHVAEVGAGSGDVSKLLLEEPIEELVAIEPDAGMFSRLEEHTGSDPRVVRKNAFFADVGAAYASYFDSVLYINVLEHVADDAAELSRVYASLRPGGHICIFVPALPWLYSAHDASIGHHRRYTKGGLRRLVAEAGFDIVSSRYFDIAGIFPWFILMTLLGRHPGPGNVSFYDRFVVPVSRMMESVIAPPIGKNLVIVAEKPLGGVTQLPQ